MSSSRPVWRLIASGSGSGSRNMATDERLLTSVSSAASFTTLRFYQWQPAAVSLGYNQKADEELDADACRQAGVDVVGRISGGRAVLHWDELTYSICFAADDPILSGLASRSCKLIARSLAAGLITFGVPAVVSPRGGRYQDASSVNGAPRRLREACFSSTCRHEVTCGGRKLVGSARRQIRNAVIQHGSVLMGPGHLQLPRLQRYATDQQRRRAEARLAARSTHLEEWCTHPVDMEDLMSCLVSGFRRTLQVELIESTLSPVEQTDLDHLANPNKLGWYAVAAGRDRLVEKDPVPIG